MGTNRTSDAYPNDIFQAFLAPDPRLTFNRSESSFDEADVIPGRVIADAGTNRLRLFASGTPTDSTALDLRVQDQGYPGPDGATLTWKDRADGIDDYRGWGFPHHPTNFISIFGTTSTTDDLHLHPKILALQSGKVLVCVDYDRGATANSVDVRIIQWDPATGWGSWQTIVSDNARTLDGQVVYNYPVLLQLDSGEVLLLRYTYDADALTWNLRVSRSVDDGATWTRAGQDILDYINANGDSGVSIDAASGFLPQWLAAAASPSGQILILTDLFDNASGTTRKTVQWVSTDDLATATLVEGNSTNNIQRPSIAVAGGLFIIAQVDTASASQGVRIRRLGDAREPYTVQPLLPSGVSADTSYFSTGLSTPNGCSIVADPTGTLYLYCAGNNSRFEAFASYDYGATWRVYTATTGTDATGAVWHNQTTGAAGAFPLEFAGAWVNGAVWMVHRWNDNGAGTQRRFSTAVMRLGGWTSVNLDKRRKRRESMWQAGWARTWHPYEPLGATPGRFTETLVGAPTRTYEDGFYQVVTAAGETAAYAETESASTNPVEHFVRVGVGPLSTAEMQGQIADGSNRFRTYVYLTNVGGSLRVEVADGTAPATILATTNVASSPVDILLAMSFEDATPKARVYVRTVDDELITDDSKWTLVHSYAPTNSGTGSRSLTLFTRASSTVRWYQAHSTYGNNASITTALGQGITNFDNPSNLHGGPLTASVSGALYTVRGISIRANQGPGRRGEGYMLDPIGDSPPERLTPEDFPSPRDGFVSASNANQVLVYDLNDLSQNASTQGYWGLYLAECNSPLVTIEGWNGVSWTSLFSSGGLNFISQIKRLGADVEQDTSVAGGTAQSQWVEQDEYAGATLYFSGGVSRTIRGNSSGYVNLDNTITAERARFTLEDADAGDPTTGAAFLIPKRQALIFRVTADYEKLRVTLARGSATLSDIRCGSLVLGPLHVIERPVEYTQTRRDTSGAVDYDADNGRRFRVPIEPTVMDLRIGVPAALQDCEIRGFEQDGTQPGSDGDYGQWDTGEVAYHVGQASSQLPALIRSWMGNAERGVAATPVVWLPWVPKNATTTQIIATQNVGPRYVWIADAATVEVVEGDIETGASSRIEEITLEDVK